MRSGDSPALLREDHRFLLWAAFAKPPESVRCWRLWRHWMDTEAHLDGASFRLVPSLYRNLASLVADDPLMRRVKGVVRYTWVQNQRRLAQQAPVFRSLAAAGVGMLVLPPAALWMAEPMLGADGKNLLPLAVGGGHPQALRASHILMGQGWLPVYPRLPHWAYDGFVLAGRSIELRRHDGYRLRIFWAQDGVGAAPDAACWTHAVPAGSALVGACFPHPEDGVRYLLRQPPGEDPLSAAGDLLLALDACADACTEGFSADLFESVQVDPRWAPLVAELRDLLDSRGVPPISICSTPAASASGILHETQATSLWARVRHQWRIYLGCLDALPGKRRTLRHLPGYLVGKWRLASMSALVPRFGRALLQVAGPRRFSDKRRTGG